MKRPTGRILKILSMIGIPIGLIASIAGIYDVFFEASPPSQGPALVTNAPNSPSINNSGNGDITIHYSQPTEK